MAKRKKSENLQDAVVRVRANLEPLKKDLAAVDQMLLRRFGANKIYWARVRAGRKEIVQDMAAIRRTIEKVTGRQHRVRVGTSIGNTNRTLSQMRTTLDRITQPQTIRVNADTTRARAQIRSLNQAIRRGATVSYGFSGVPTGGTAGVPRGARPVAIPVLPFQRNAPRSAGAGKALSQATGVVAPGAGMYQLSGAGGGFGRSFMGGLMGQVAFRGGPLSEIAAGGLFGGPAGAVGAGVGAAAFGAGAATVGTTVHGLQSLDQIEQYRRVLAKVIKDQQKANELVEEFDKLDLELPVGLEEVAGVGTRLAAAGVELEELKRATVAVLDVSSVSLAGVREGSGRIARILAEISSKGRVLGTELRELSTLGINVEAITQAGFGMDSRELAKRSQDYEFTSQELIRGFLKGFEDFAGGAVKARLTTLSGSLDILMDQFDRMARRVAEPIFEPVIDQINSLASSIEKGDLQELEDSLAAAAKALASFTGGLVNFIRALGGNNHEGGFSGFLGSAGREGAQAARDLEHFASQGYNANAFAFNEETQEWERRYRDPSSPFSNTWLTEEEYSNRLREVRQNMWPQGQPPSQSEFEISTLPGSVQNAAKEAANYDDSLIVDTETGEKITRGEFLRRRATLAMQGQARMMGIGNPEIEFGLQGEQLGKAQSLIRQLSAKGTDFSKEDIVALKAAGIPVGLASRVRFGLSGEDELLNQVRLGEITSSQLREGLWASATGAGAGARIGNARASLPAGMLSGAASMAGNMANQLLGGAGDAFMNTPAGKAFARQGGIGGLMNKGASLWDDLVDATPGLAASQNQDRVDEEVLADRRKRFERATEIAEKMAAGSGIAFNIAAGADGAARVVAERLKDVNPAISQNVGFEGLGKLTQRSIDQARANEIQQKQLDKMEELRKQIEDAVNNELGEIAENTREFRVSVQPN